MSRSRGAPLWPAGHLPRKGGDWQLRRRRLFCNFGDWRNQSGRLISLLVGEMAGRPERLSWRSSDLFAPWLSGPEDRVEYGEEFSRRCDEGDDLGLSGCHELVAERLEDRVVPDRDHRAHEQQERTPALPPPMKLLPRHWPDCRVNGARPTSAAAWRRSRLPSSGSSAIRVRAMVGPTPGTEDRRSPLARHAGEPRTASPMSWSTGAIWSTVANGPAASHGGVTQRTGATGPASGQAGPRAQTEIREHHHESPAESLALYQRPPCRGRTGSCPAGDLPGNRRDDCQSACRNTQHSRTGHRSGARRTAGMGKAETRGARPRPAPCRRHLAHPQRRAGAAGDARHRQGDPGNAGRRRGLGGRRAGIFRRRSRGVRRRLHRSRRPVCLYAARSARRMRRHRRMELSDPDGRLEVRAGIGHGQCDGVQALGKHPAFGAGAGRDLYGGRPARRNFQCRSGFWRCRRGTCRPPGGRQDFHDRFGADRRARCCRLPAR